MVDVKAQHFEEIPFYDGPGRIENIRFHPAGRALGVTAWGMNVLAIDAGCAAYPEHDHVGDGQEEVYVVLRGEGTLEVGGVSTALSSGTLVRVGPLERRKIFPGPNGIVVLAIGATPGQAHAPRGAT